MRFWKWDVEKGLRTRRGASEMPDDAAGAETLFYFV